MADPFQNKFFNPQVVRGYNRLLIGETQLDKLAFSYYADLFYNMGCRRRKRSKILDLGSGPGYLGIELASRIKEGSIHLLDISPDMIEKARQNVGQRFSGNKNIKFDYTVDDAANLLRHVRKNSLDLIIARHVIQIPKDPEEILKQAYETLRPNGKLIFTLIGYNTYNFSENGNSLFENEFFSKLTRAAFEVLPSYLSKLPKDAIHYLREEGIVNRQDLSLKIEALYPKYDKNTILDKLDKAGVPLSKVNNLILPETHTVAFKQGYSLVLGSVPIPGLWNVFPLFDEVTRYEMVHEIYEKAFPGNKHIPIQTHDPVFIVTK